MTRRKRCSAYFWCFPIVAILAVTARAQLTSVAGAQAQPVPGAGHDYIHMLAETVNPANGALSVRITVPVPPGRGISVPFAFGYDSNAEHHFPAPQFTTAADNPGYLSQGGWAYLVPQLNGIQRDNYWYSTSPRQRYDCYYFTDYMLTALDGQIHPLNISAAEPSTAPSCNNGIAPVTGVRPSAYPTGSYERFQAETPSDPGNTGLPSVVTASDMDGTVYYFPNFKFITSDETGFSVLPSWIEDRNGNKITFNDNNNGNFSVTDTLGRPLLSSSGFGTTGNTVTISGIANPYTVTWGSSSSNWSYNTQITYDGGSGQCVGLPGTYQVTLPEITVIQLPNGTSYTFQYDATSGLLSKLIYPTGGYVRYVWGTYPMSDYLTYNDSNNILDTCHMKHDTQAVTDRYVSFDGVTEVLHQHFSYATPTWLPDHVTLTSQSWTQKTTTVTTYDLVTGTNFNAVYAYVPGSAFHAPNDAIIYTSNSIPVENTISHYSTSGSLLQTVAETFVGGVDLPPDVETTLDSGQISQTTHVYSSFLLDDEYEYDFGSGSPGPLLKHTHIDYAALQATPIFPSAPSILDQPKDVIVYDGSGNRVAETDYNYDQAAVTGVSATQHDETNYGASSTVPRGNPTTVTRWLNTGSSSQTTYAYDETGEVSSMTAPCGNAACADMRSGAIYRTAYSYSDRPAGGNAAGNSNAYLTSITNPLEQTESFSYNYASGNLLTDKDVNQNTTQYSYNDPLGRLTKIDAAAGTPQEATKTFSYPTLNITNTAADEQTLNDQKLTSSVTVDGLGKTLHSTDATGAMVDTTYDGVGSVQSTSNQYYSNSDPTYGIVSYLYDSLGRKTYECEQDNSSTATTVCNPQNSYQHWVYYGNSVTYTDETGRAWQRTYDALGRLIKIIEDANNSKLETDYKYDALGNLWRVDQWGGANGSPGDHIRTFTYDSASRLICASNPENSTSQCPTQASSSYTVGTTGYSYDANGNVMSKTSPATNASSGTITANYDYDSLNRIFSKSSTDTAATPTACYQYDQSLQESSGANMIGRLANEWTQSASSGVCAQTMPTNGTTLLTSKSILSYDPMGRATNVQTCIYPNCTTSTAQFPIAFTYDLAGDLTSYTNGNNSALFTDNYDGTGRLSSITSTWTDSTHPSPLLSSPTYNPAGGLTGANYGSGNGITQCRWYDPRLRVTGETDTSGELSGSVTCPMEQTQ